MKIAAYCRVSTDKKEQQESLQHQKEFFTEYARRNGHILVRLYADEGISGTSLKKREEFRLLLEDARLGLFEVVVVKDVSRFARNTVDALQSVRTLKALGINTLFINANMTSIGDGEFALTLFSAMAQEESNNLSKRVKWGKRINAEKGRVPPRVFGYDKMDNFTLAINEEEARIVRKVFSLYIDRGLGCRSISMALNRDGDQTKLGNAWDARGVKRLLSTPLYGGILVNHKYEIEDFLTGRQVALPSRSGFITSGRNGPSCRRSGSGAPRRSSLPGANSMPPANPAARAATAESIPFPPSSNAPTVGAPSAGRAIHIKIPGSTGGASPMTSTPRKPATIR